MTCPIHGPARRRLYSRRPSRRIINIHDGEGNPPSEFYQAVHRIADRITPRVSASFLEAVRRVRDSIDMTALRAALRGIDPKSADLANVQQAVLKGRLASILSGSQISNQLLGAITAVGEAGAGVVADVAGVEFRFNARDPNTVLAARQFTADLVKAVDDAARETVRIVTTAGADLGLTTNDQARVLRETVGLPPNWARAPLNLERDLRSGRAHAATRRRLSAADKAQIRSRIKAGTVDDEFVQTMRARYTDSLVNRRAMTIARTETMRAANAGLRMSWRQAARGGVIPGDARRFWVVTPDDRLRETHAAVPFANEDGVPLEGVYETPLGTVVGPPLEPNCRCSEALQFPGQAAVL